MVTLTCIAFQMYNGHLFLFIASLLLSVDLFLPHIAIAFGFAVSFTDIEALSFTLDELSVINIFGSEISFDSLKAKFNLKRIFNRFSDFSLSGSGMPIDPITFEVFDVKKFLPELQFSLDLAPSIKFAASNFKASDLYDALFPKSTPTIKSFGSFVKKDIMTKLQHALDGMFDAKVDVPIDGLTIVDSVSFGVNGVQLGDYTEFNNQLFPPMIDVDALQVSVFFATVRHLWLMGNHHNIFHFNTRFL